MSQHEHKWGWSSVTDFTGSGRSGTYAHCECGAEDRDVFDRLRAEMPAAQFKHGDTVTYRDERWRWDITGTVRLDLVKVVEYEAIVLSDFVNPLFSSFSDPLERRYSILCRGKDGDDLFERTPTADFLIPSNHGGTVAEWRARQPKPQPYKLEDDDPALVEPRLRSIGIQFEEHNSSYRCSNCHTLQREGTPMAYVRDGWHVGDSWCSLVESYQRNRWNSHGSGWCPPCAHKLLPLLCIARFKFSLTGYFPMKVYMKPVCGTCKQDMSGGSYYYRNVGEDKWEVYCRACRYATHSHDMYEGGFGLILGSSATYIGTVGAGESVSVSV